MMTPVGEAEPIYSFDYTLDRVGNRMVVAEDNGDLLTLTYDAAYQLTREQHSGAAAYDYAYAYDGTGNRLTLVASGAARTTYAYDQAGQLLVETRPNGALRSYTYDQRGNLTLIDAAGTLQTQTWDGENRLSVIETAASRHTFAYDPDGLRRSWNTPAAATRFVWDNQNLLQEVDGAGETEVAYTNSPGLYGELLAQRKAEATSFYHFDGMGSTTELTSADETETDTYRYKVFGEWLTRTVSVNPRFRYVGKLGYYRHSGSDLDLDYLRARYYQPRIGRFLSRDPILMPGSPYPYALNSPGNWVDPSGMFQQPCNMLCPTQNPPMPGNRWDVPARRFHRDRKMRQWIPDTGAGFAYGDEWSSLANPTSGWWTIASLRSVIPVCR